MAKTLPEKETKLLSYEPGKWVTYIRFFCYFTGCYLLFWFFRNFPPKSSQYLFMYSVSSDILYLIFGLASIFGVYFLSRFDHPADKLNRVIFFISVMYLVSLLLVTVFIYPNFQALYLYQLIQKQNPTYMLQLAGLFLTSTLPHILLAIFSGSIVINTYRKNRARKRKMMSEVGMLIPDLPDVSPVGILPQNNITARQTVLGFQTSRQFPPQLSDRYKESEFIGEGGFANIFKARSSDGQYVAIKIPISPDETTGRSFLAELQNWTKLDHPNIVKVYDFNILPVAYFEMELCEGSLSDVKKPVENRLAALLIFNICDGLKYAHQKKIVHRDLKPQNILLSNKVPKISDWGLSRVISESKSSRVTSFSPYYAAPEQMGKGSKDERTDLWQLGVIFYELVTGTLPFTGDSLVDVMAAIATKEQTPPSGINPSARDVEGIIQKCLEKDKRQRYQSVEELQGDLARYLKINYTESLKMSVTVGDIGQSASYCGELVLISMKSGDIASAYKFVTDLAEYTKGDTRSLVLELSEQLKIRMENGLYEVPDELLQKADFIVHTVSSRPGRM